MGVWRQAVNRPGCILTTRGSTKVSGHVVGRRRVNFDQSTSRGRLVVVTGRASHSVAQVVQLGEAPDLIWAALAFNWHITVETFRPLLEE